MKKLEGKEVVENYLRWLRDNIKFKNIKNALISVDSPFLDKHNDYMRLYIKKNGEDSFYLTDDGMTFYELKTSGFNLTEKKKEIFEVFINGQGVKFNEETEELFTESNWEDLSQKKNDLLQAMINVGDMFIASTPYIKTLFFEEVANFFKEKDISAIPDVFIDGGGYKDKVDFIIPSSKDKKEKLIKLVNNPSRDFYKKFLFTFIDIKRGKTIHSKADQILFINDYDKKINEKDIQAIKSYSVTPVLWSQKNESMGVFS